MVGLEGSLKIMEPWDGWVGRIVAAKHPEQATSQIPKRGIGMGGLEVRGDLGEVGHGGAWGRPDPLSVQRLPHKIRKLHAALERMLVSVAASHGAGGSQ